MSKIKKLTSEGRRKKKQGAEGVKKKQWKWRLQSEKKKRKKKNERKIANFENSFYHKKYDSMLNIIFFQIFLAKDETLP